MDSSEPVSQSTASAETSAPSASSATDNARFPEPAVLVPKAQLDLLVNQLSVLATSVVEKQRFNSLISRDSSSQFGPGSRHSHGRSDYLSRSGASRKRDSSNATRVSGTSSPLRKPTPPSSSPHHHLGHTVSDFPKQDIEDLMRTLPKYSGHVSESFTWWTTQIDSFLKTFNLRNIDIEYFIPKLLSDKAFDLYKNVQKNVHAESIKAAATSTNDYSDTNESTNDTDNNPASAYKQSHQHARVRMKPLHWKIIKKELAKLDNPVSRTLYIHSKIKCLRTEVLSQSTNNQTPLSSSINSPASSAIDSAPTSPDLSSVAINGQTIDALITNFRALETQLEYPAPLPDRLVLLFDVFPECQSLVLEKLNTIYEDTLSMPFQNIDEVCDFVLIYKDEILKQLQQAQQSNGGMRKKRTQINGQTTSNTNTVDNTVTSSAYSSACNTDKGADTNKLNDRVGDRREKLERFKGRSHDGFKSSAATSPSPSITRQKKDRQSLPKAQTTPSKSYDVAGTPTKPNGIASEVSTPVKSGPSDSYLAPVVAVSNVVTASPISNVLQSIVLNDASSTSSSSEYETDDGTINESGAKLSDSLAAGSASSAASSTICNYCGRVGHKSTKCFKKKKDRQREKLKVMENCSSAPGSSSTEHSESGEILEPLEPIDTLTGEED